MTRAFGAHRMVALRFVSRTDIRTKLVTETAGEIGRKTPNHADYGCSDLRAHEFIERFSAKREHNRERSERKFHFGGKNSASERI